MLLLGLVVLLYVVLGIAVTIFSYKENKVTVEAEVVVVKTVAPAKPTMKEWANKARADCFRLGGYTRFYGRTVFCTKKDYPVGRENTLLFERRRHLPSGED